MRLDQYLVKAGHYQTRARAADAINRSAVRVNGVIAKKTGQKVPSGAEIKISDPASAYVSRAALKLIRGLEHFAFDVKDRSALDVGASTGGFTQVLLEHEAAHVTAIDVGHDQLHPSLRDHPNITQIDGLNARELTSAHLVGRNIDAIVSDVSFISLKIALPPALQLAQSGAWCILLVKPQFEAGKDAIGKGGILKEASLGPKIADNLRQWLDAQPDWSSLDYIPSPIEGSDGNYEFLIGGTKA